MAFPTYCEQQNAVCVEEASARKDVLEHCFLLHHQDDVKGALHTGDHVRVGRDGVELNGYILHVYIRIYVYTMVCI